MEIEKEMTNRLINLKVSLANGCYPGIDQEQGKQMVLILNDIEAGDIKDPDIFNKWCWFVGRMVICMRPQFDGPLYQMVRFADLMGWVEISQFINLNR